MRKSALKHVEGSVCQLSAPNTVFTSEFDLPWILPFPFSSMPLPQVLR